MKIKFLNILHFIRWWNAIIATLPFIVIFFVAKFNFPKSFNNSTDVLIIFTLLCFTLPILMATGFIFNDIRDHQIDSINRPTQYSIGRTISLKYSKFLFILFSLLTLSLSLVIYALGYKNWLYIAIIVYFLLVLYSKYLKPIAFLGNILIAFLASALPVVMYNFIVKFNNNNLESIFFPLIATYSIFTFLIMLVREINLDIEDLEGDKQFGCKTLPILLGFKKTKTIIFSICVIHIIFSIFASCYFKNYYFTYLLIDCILIYYLFRLFRSTLKNEIIYCRNILRYTLLIGLIGFATEFSIKNSTQHGIGKIGAKVLNLSNGILLNSSAEMNICTSNSPTSPIPKR